MRGLVEICDSVTLFCLSGTVIEDYSSVARIFSFKNELLTDEIF